MITANDIFAGGGGTSTALVSLGVNLLAALNHNPTAIQTHRLNHPNTLHFRHDAESFNISQIPRADILTLSPECRRHSNAASKAIKQERTNPQTSLWTDELPDTWRSRNTMRQVIRFAQELAPKAVIVENIIPVTRWDGFSTWLKDMSGLGYAHKILCLNAAHFGVAQSRERFYAVFWKDIPAPPLDLTSRAFCPICEQDVDARQQWRPNRQYGMWNQQYDYVCVGCNKVVIPHMPCARDIIDLSLPTISIRERAQKGYPLVAATLSRIQRCLDNPRTNHTPFVSMYYSNTNSFTTLDQPLLTVTGTNHHLLVMPDKNGRLEDARTRFLSPHELQRAMGFPDTYRFCGNYTQIVSQIGNAVAVPVMQELVRRLLTVLN